MYLFVFLFLLFLPSNLLLPHSILLPSVDALACSSATFHAWLTKQLSQSTTSLKVNKKGFAKDNEISIEQLDRDDNELSKSDF